VESIYYDALCTQQPKLIQNYPSSRTLIWASKSWILCINGHKIYKCVTTFTSIPWVCPRWAWPRLMNCFRWSVSWGQFHQHAYMQLLHMQMLWLSTSIFPSILCPTLPGLNFINVLHTRIDPKSVKRYWQLDWVLTLWWATGVKAWSKYVDEIDPSTLN